MWQVTALVGDEEVGFGVGSSLEYAEEECKESIPSMYHESEVRLQYRLD